MTAVCGISARAMVNANHSVAIAPHSPSSHSGFAKGYEASLHDVQAGTKLLQEQDLVSPEKDTPA